MGIGEKLKNLRISSKKTLKDESAIFNVSINTIYRWEHELTAPRKSSLKKIAAHFNVPLEWLLSDSDSDIIKNTKCNFCILNPENPYNNMEHLLIKMFRNLRDNNKYITLGYIERIYVEDIDEAEQNPCKNI